MPVCVRAYVVLVGVQRYILLVACDGRQHRIVGSDEQYVQCWAIGLLAEPPYAAARSLGVSGGAALLADEREEPVGVVAAEAAIEDIDAALIEVRQKSQPTVRLLAALNETVPNADNHSSRRPTRQHRRRHSSHVRTLPAQHTAHSTQHSSRGDEAHSAAS